METSQIIGPQAVTRPKRLKRRGCGEKRHNPPAIGVAKCPALAQKPGEQRGLIQAAPYLFDILFARGGIDG
ncbi:hypothetical protein [Acidocella facilis]|uniref:hypothetical protein n=1 Tax=Acidocella facilis TaxID=525 RepID=UPI001F1DCCA7|nr:hypothetical protein [Acidocella facilis]